MDCPVNLFAINFDHHPFAKQARIIEVTLNAGDCIYIPAYYFVQSQTLTKDGIDETIMVAQQYASHSQFVDLIFKGLENGVLTEERHEYDKYLAKKSDDMKNMF